MKKVYAGDWVKVINDSTYFSKGQILQVRYGFEDDDVRDSWRNILNDDYQIGLNTKELNDWHIVDLADIIKINKTQVKETYQIF